VLTNTVGSLKSLYFRPTAYKKVCKIPQYFNSTSQLSRSVFLNSNFIVFPKIYRMFAGGKLKVWLYKWSTKKKVESWVPMYWYKFCA